MLRGIICTTLFAIHAKLTNVELTNFTNQTGNEEVSPKQHRKNMIQLFAISFTGCFCFAVIMTAYKFISATKIMMITNSNPFFIVIFAGILLKEKVSRLDILAVILILIGGFFITYHKVNNPHDSPHPYIGYTISFVCVIILALQFMGIRDLNQKVHHLLFPFYFSFFMVLITIF